MSAIEAQDAILCSESGGRHPRQSRTDFCAQSAYKDQRRAEGAGERAGAGLRTIEHHGEHMQLVKNWCEMVAKAVDIMGTRYVGDRHRPQSQFHQEGFITMDGWAGGRAGQSTMVGPPPPARESAAAGLVHRGPFISPAAGGRATWDYRLADGRKDTAAKWIGSIEKGSQDAKCGRKAAFAAGPDPVLATYRRLFGAS